MWTQVKGILTLTLHGNSNIYVDSQFAKRQKGNFNTQQVMKKHEKYKSILLQTWISRICQLELGKHFLWPKQKYFESKNSILQSFQKPF